MSETNWTRNKYGDVIDESGVQVRVVGFVLASGDAANATTDAIVSARAELTRLRRDNAALLAALGHARSQLLNLGMPSTDTEAAVLDSIDAAIAQAQEPQS